MTRCARPGDGGLVLSEETHDGQLPGDNRRLLLRATNASFGHVTRPQKSN